MEPTTSEITLLSLNEMGAFSFSWDTGKWAQTLTQICLVLWYLTGLPSVCPIEDIMAGDPEKQLQPPRTSQKDSRECPLCLSLCFPENELGLSWASHEGVWRTNMVHSVNRAPSTPFKDPSAVTSGKWDLAKPWDIVVSSVSCDCWNVVSSASWESTWKRHRVVAIAVPFETRSQVASDFM